MVVEKMREDIQGETNGPRKGLEAPKAQQECFEVSKGSHKQRLLITLETTSIVKIQLSWIAKYL